MLRAVRSTWLAVAMAITMAFVATTPAQAGGLAQADSLSAEQRQVRDAFVDSYQSTSVGQSFDVTNADGRELTFVKTTEGVRVSKDTADSSTTQTMAADFCLAAAQAAVYAIGAAVFAGVAASGGTIAVAGVVIGPSVAGMFSAALAGGGGLSALIAQYIC
ncbi:hypothetical protein GCM10007079_48450 [Nocardiopsis terrae]|uniref:Uncharacterized protein n=1 Tax=Nocardiopsis terrae TaxID=372655 RepID=A0ABR9HAH4_9ACTN|nr:hypothetical protein [Nocardiopsis terrae]MBE1456039.1 hypothetical protein [Nocardiopsis terrae]GHC96188.1 hypothetical protein GCM10007079_48450 [Nocardiopsis terrae]